MFCIFAWFVATQSATVETDASKGTFSVGQTTLEDLGLKAKIHFIAGSAHDASVLLTTFGNTTGTNPIVSPTDSDNTALITGAKANSGAAVTYKTLGTSAGWTYIPISAWIEATEDGGDIAAWRYAVTEKSDNYTGKVTFTYASKTDVAKLLSTEVYFYGVEGATAPSSFVKANQIQASSTNAKVEFTVSAKDLTTDHETAESALTIGYIVVRAEGGLRDHNTSVTYSAEIESNAIIQ